MLKNILPSGSKCCRINHLRTTQACLLLVYDKYWIKRNLESRFDLNTAQDEDPLTLPQHRAITDTLPVEVHLLKRYIHDVDFALHRRISQYYKDRYYVPERARLTEKVLSQFPRDNAEGERRLTKGRAKAVLAVLISESPNNCWQHLDERFDKVNMCCYTPFNSSPFNISYRYARKTYESSPENLVMLNIQTLARRWYCL